MFFVKWWILIFCMFFSKDSSPTILYLLPATTRRIIQYLGFVSIGETQVTEIKCLKGTSDWFAIVNIFKVSC